MRTAILAAVLLLAALESGAQTVRELEVRDKPVRDVLLSLAKLYDASILPDDTVSGRVSYYFAEPNLESALEQLLAPLGLYYWRENGLYRVSSLRVVGEDDASTLRIDANDVSVPRLLDRLAEVTGVPVLYRSVDGLRIHLHARRVSLRDVLDLVKLQYPELSLFEEKQGYLMKRAPNPAERSTGTEESQLARHCVRRSGDSYSIDAPPVGFRNLLSAFFAAAERQFVLIGRDAVNLPPVRLHEKSFDAMLAVLLDLGSCRFEEVDGIYYIYEVDADLALSRLTRTIVVPLQHVPVDSLQELLPARFTGSEHIRMDPRTNSVVLTGRNAEILPIRGFLAELDRPLTNTRLHRFDLHYLSAERLLSVLPEEFRRKNPLVLPGRRAFVVSLTAAEAERMKEYLLSVDVARQSTAVALRYVRVSDLLDHLPPGIGNEDIVVTPDPSRFFLIGGTEKQRLLRERLKLIDQPPRQIRYELVVMQYHKGSSANRAIELNAAPLAPGDRNAVLGTIGRLLSLRFDFVSAFGYLFALKLNLDLANANARVLADTTLNGISGEAIAFRNTETFRYRDTVVNPDTGKLDPTGVVREITSGLTIEIAGWVSGDGLVTMDVSSSVSARGADTTGSATALPATSEKVVKTHVRTPSGTPVVIGGLKELTRDSRSDRLPLLGDLPLIGMLFEKKEARSQDTELAIYILPEVEEVLAPHSSLSQALLTTYQRLAVGYRDE